jgi:hypothetical protein
MPQGVDERAAGREIVVRAAVHLEPPGGGETPERAGERRRKQRVHAAIRSRSWAVRPAAPGGPRRSASSAKACRWR